MLVTSWTTTVLLERLLEPENDEVWQEFDDRYRPILIAFGRRLGLSAADAEDIAQETLTKFLRSYRAGHYDRQRGRLRSWILTIARRCILDVHRMRNKRRQWRGRSALEELPADETLESTWDESSRAAILTRALAAFRSQTKKDPRTVQAFEGLVFEKQSAADVAADLGMSVDSVYVAKNRCAKELKQIVDQMRDMYEADVHPP